MVPRLLAAWKRVSFPAWTAPLALLLAALLCYALRLPQLGFYWDDWPYLYLYKLGGYPALATSLGLDRPALSWLYLVTLTVLGYNPLAWQIFALLARWVLGCAFWLALRQAWPGQRSGPFWAALLFLIYPGFTQQWIPVVWGNAFVLYAAVFFSLAITTWAARQATARTLWLTALPGLALSALAMFSTEYFFGLELLRPALVWLALSASGLTRRQRIVKTVLAWLPYLALMDAFVLWRTYFQPSAHANLSLLADLNRHPLAVLLELATRVLQDGALAFFAAWGQALDFAPMVEAIGFEVVLFSLGAAAVFWLLLTRYPEAPPRGYQQGWAAESMALGIFAFLAAGWPVWLTRLPLHMGFPWDRYTLSLSAGAALFMAGFISWAARSPAVRALLLALLVGAAAGFHNHNALLYRRDWNEARDLLWQLAWRTPAIQPGTALLVDGTGLRYYEDDSLSGMLNWPYGGSSGDPTRMDILVMNIPERLKSMNFLTPGSEIRKGFGPVVFRGNTNQAVVLTTQPQACLQVLDPQRDRARADLTEYARRALPLSRPELLLHNAMGSGGADAVSILGAAEIFGPEPEHKWCYYYESAALAAQKSDWEGVILLKREAESLGYKPLQASEYLIFIEAAMRLYAWPDARQMSQIARDESAGTLPALCAAWENAAEWGGDSEIYRSGRAEFTCTE
jgi:hypothetical protein